MVIMNMGHGYLIVAAMSPIINSNPASITTSGNLNDTAPLAGALLQKILEDIYCSSSISLPGLLGDAISEGFQMKPDTSMMD